MKYATFLLLTLFSSILFSQKEEQFFDLFKEITLSVNQTAVKNTNTSNRIGFGVGIFHTWRDSSRINIISGLSYNCTNQFKKSISNGHFSNYSNVSIYIHNLSIPVIVRHNFGKKYKVFVETGVFGSFNAGVVLHATENVYLPGKATTSNQVKMKGAGNANAGFLIGLGTSFPIKNQVFLVKIQFQSGLFQDVYFDQENIFNRFASISLGYKLNRK